MKDIKQVKVDVYSVNGKKLAPTNLRVAKTIIGRKKAKWIKENESLILLYSKSEFKALKKLVIEEENRICYICKSIMDIGDATVDHIIPKSRGGCDFRYNLACSCPRCNEDKKNLTLEEYIRHIEKNRKKYKYIDLKHLKRQLVERRLKYDKAEKEENLRLDRATFPKAAKTR